MTTIPCAHCGQPAAKVRDRWVHVTRTMFGGGRPRPTFVTCPGLRTTVAAPARAAAHYRGAA